MAIQIIQNQRLWMAQYALSPDVSSLTLDNTADVVENSALADTYKSRLGGLKSTAIAFSGFWNEADFADVLSVNIGVSDTFLTFGSEGATVGNVAHFTKIIQGEYSRGASVGDMFAFDVSAEGDGNLIKGELFVNTTATATANGATSQLGAVSATQNLYGAMHVTSVSGTSPTLDVTVESDSADTFGGAETTRMTFTQATAITSEWPTPIAGAITDTWWRVAYTIGGSDTPTFTFVVSLGIL